MNYVFLAGILSGAGAGGGPPTDIYFPDVMAQMEFVTPTELSSYARTSTTAIYTRPLNTTGNTIRSSTVVSKFGTRSLLMSGQTDCGAIIAGDAETSTELRFGTDNFCIEFWYNRNGEPSATGYFFGQWVTNANQRSLRCGYNPTTNQFTLEVSTNGTNTLTANYDCDTDGISVATVFDGNWHHLAFVRNGTELAVYVDGDKGAGTAAIGVSDAVHRQATAQSYYAIGAFLGTLSRLSPTDALPGYMSEFRLTIGVPRYTAGFTPPTAIFGRNVGADSDFADVMVLYSFDEEFGFNYYGYNTPDINFRTESNSGPDLTNGFLDVGSNDTIIRFNESAGWNLGSGDFTIELFGYSATGFSANRTILANWNPAVGERAWALISTGTTGRDFALLYSTDGTTFADIGDVNLDANTEYNLCIERSGSNLYFYVNGTLIDTETFSVTIFSASATNTTLAVGAQGDETSRSNAASGTMLKAFRVTEGVARYGGASYTVPTLPLPKSA